jgi:hypothetical protein
VTKDHDDDGNDRDRGRLARSATSHEIIEAANYASILIQFNARVSQIAALTGLDERMVKGMAKTLSRQVNGTVYLATGRFPTNLSYSFDRPQVHLETSIFLRFYAECLAALEPAPADGSASNGSGIDPSTPALITAFNRHRAVFVGSELRFDVAYLAAQYHHNNRLTSVDCRRCGTSVLQVPVEDLPKEREGEGFPCPVCKAVLTPDANLPADESTADDATRYLFVEGDEKRLPKVRSVSLLVQGQRHDGTVKPAR